VSAQASVQSPVTTPLLTTLKTDIASRKSVAFDALLKRWESLYGAKAVDPLLSIAGDSHAPDPDRYVALMGAARLGGFAAAPLFMPFLKDGSWMIRSAALRILTGLENPQTAYAVLPLLKDPALVVRLEAVAAVEKLNPVGAVPALVDTLANPANYHGGKALWVPSRAIDALVSLRASRAQIGLRPLLDRSTDPELLAKTVDALDTLSGQPPERELDLHDRVKRWKTTLGAVAANVSDAISSHQGAPARSKKTTK
jgi:HEAT repeat protein